MMLLPSLWAALILVAIVVTSAPDENDKPASPRRFLKRTPGIREKRKFPPRQKPLAVAVESEKSDAQVGASKSVEPHHLTAKAGDLQTKQSKLAILKDRPKPLEDKLNLYEGKTKEGGNDPMLANWKQEIDDVHEQLEKESAKVGFKKENVDKLSKRLGVLNDGYMKYDGESKAGDPLLANWKQEIDDVREQFAKESAEFGLMKENVDKLSKRLTVLQDGYMKYTKKTKEGGKGPALAIWKQEADFVR